MSPEPMEAQILQQLLGPDLGRMVFALNTMAGSVAQMGQQLQQQAEHIQQQAASTTAAATPPATTSENPWTGPNGAVRESPEAVGAMPSAEEGP